MTLMQPTSDRKVHTVFPVHGSFNVNSIAKGDKKKKIKRTMTECDKDRKVDKAWQQKRAWQR